MLSNATKQPKLTVERLEKYSVKYLIELVVLDRLPPLCICIFTYEYMFYSCLLFMAVYYPRFSTIYCI